MKNSVIKGEKDQNKPYKQFSEIKTAASNPYPQTIVLSLENKFNNRKNNAIN